MVATLHPQVATITPQYAVPFTLSCAAGRPALVEQTAAVLVIPSLDCVTNGVSLVSFFFYFFLFVFVLFFWFSHSKNKTKKPSLVFAEGMEACAILWLCPCYIFNVSLFPPQHLLKHCLTLRICEVLLCKPGVVKALCVAAGKLQHSTCFLPSLTLVL
jgi:hypothetical protein